ncbi:MAG: glycosyltransferase family 4 protein [Sedimentisphaerales bacterium]|nr:glycosyltransferase family 4 protein [Sedimentisphaerales bacterium]
MLDLLVLTNNSNSASFLYRVEPHLPILTRNGIRTRVEVLPKGSDARRRLFKRSAEFDGVFLHRKVLSLHDALCLRHYARAIVYDLDDAVMYKCSEPSNSGSGRFRRFRRTVKSADLVLVGNPYLAERALRFNCRTTVLPTGVDTQMYQHGDSSRTDGRVRLVWIGSRSTLVHLEAIKPALEQIGRRHPGTQLRLIADSFLDLENMPVEKCVWSKEGHAGPLRSSDIGLAPLSDDAFTRGKCAFKILQYYACGLPVVASPVGVNASYVEDKVTGFWAETQEQWIERAGQLVDDPLLRERMGQKALAKVRDYDAAVIGQKLTDLILEMFGRLRERSAPTEQKVDIRGAT